jgi:hypothetical protein
MRSQLVPRTTGILIPLVTGLGLFLRIHAIKSRSVGDLAR